MNQKALVVNSTAESIDGLNKHLANGWTVLDTCPMPSSPASSDNCFTSHATYPTCLVIIGKHGLLPKA